MCNITSIYKEQLNKVNREGVDALKHRIANSDFFSAPASARFHLSIPGGLAKHSLDVLNALKSILRDNEDGTYSYVIAGKEIERITEENAIVMALLHDLCKTDFYVESIKNQKTYELDKLATAEKWQIKHDNKGDFIWETVPSFEVEDQIPLGHGEKSVFMIMKYMQLEPCELYAIRWHMGFPEGNEKYTFQAAVKKHPIIWALHTADMMASAIMEANDGPSEIFADTDN